MSTQQHTSGTDPRLIEAWQRYYAALEEMRRDIEASPQYRDVPEQRPMAYHVLMELQAMVYNFAIAPKLEHPRINRNTAWQTEFYTLGGNGPDFLYSTLFLDGSQTYRLTGNMHDSRLVLAQVSGALPGTPGNSFARNFDLSDFEIAPDGAFEFIISGQKHDGNWIELDPTSHFQWILFRPTVDAWDSVPAEFHIERISPVPADHYAGEEFDAGQIAARIDAGTHWLHYMTHEWVIEFYKRVLANAGGPNLFEVIGPAISGVVGSPTAEYLLAAYEVDEDEALLIEFPDVPGGAYWGLQTFNVWLQSLNFRTRQTALNGTQIAPDADGRIRVILSARDPLTANWLDVAGHAKGQILLRNYRTLRSTRPTMTRVKFSELPNLLPPDTKRVTPEERKAALKARNAAYIAWHGE